MKASCPRCGAVVGRGDAYCPRCATRLDGAKPESGSVDLLLSEIDSPGALSLSPYNMTSSSRWSWRALFRSLRRTFRKAAAMICL